MRISGADQGWSVRLSREIEPLIRKLAEKEDRTIKTVIERAVREYAERKKTHR